MLNKNPYLFIYIIAAKPQTPPLLRQSSVPVETQQSVFTSVQQEMAARRQKAAATRQDSRLSVKSLIESIENTTKQVKAGNFFINFDCHAYLCVSMAKIFYFSHANGTLFVNFGILQCALSRVNCFR